MGPGATILVYYFCSLASLVVLNHVTLSNFAMTIVAFDKFVNASFGVRGSVFIWNKVTV